jgi:hypothetical protein
MNLIIFEKVWIEVEAEPKRAAPFIQIVPLVHKKEASGERKN